MSGLKYAKCYLGIFPLKWFWHKDNIQIECAGPQIKEILY